MFCSNCGSKLEPDSIFCVSCGTKLNTGNSSSNPININTLKETTNKILKGVFNSLKNPSESTLILKENLTSIQAKILFFATLLLIPLINLATIKSTITNFFISFAKFNSALDGDVISFLDISNTKTLLNATLEETLPFSSIFLYNILFLALLFSIILGLIFLFLKFSKEDLIFNDGIYALIFPALILLVSSILTPLLLSLGFIITIIGSLILTSLFIITTYTSFKSLMNNAKLLPYVTSVAIVVSYFFSYYVQIQMLFDNIMRNAVRSNFF